jgi:hypothetical protein
VRSDLCCPRVARREAVADNLGSSMSASCQISPIAVSGGSKVNAEVKFFKVVILHMCRQDPRNECAQGVSGKVGNLLAKKNAEKLSALQ